MSEEPQSYGTGQLRALLRDRHLPKRGRPEWAYLEEVRNAPGFDATRSLDALAVHLWPSRGHEIHGYEIKCSRSDWLRELKDPHKAAVRQVTGGFSALDSDDDRARFLRNLKCAQQHDFEHLARSWLTQMRALAEGLANSHRFAAQVNNEQAERLQQCLDTLASQKNSYVPDLDTMQPLLDWLQAAEDQLAEVAS